MYIPESDPSPTISKDILASPYWLLIPILTYPLVPWQKIFAAGIHQQKNASGIPSVPPAVRGLLAAKRIYEEFDEEEDEPEAWDEEEGL